MAGVGNIGSRIAMARSPTHGKPKKAKSASREVLCNSIESLSEQSESNHLFPPRRVSSIDISNYGTIKQIAEYRDESSGALDFLCRTIDLLFCTVTVKVLLLLFSGLPVSMLVVGSTYKSECPKDLKLPLYLLVGGGCGLLKLLFLGWRQQKMRDYELLDNKSDYDEDSEDLVLNRFVRFTNNALTMFLIVWFGLGNYWFYSIWKPKFEQPLHEPNNWCHPTLFWYMFYNFMVSYVVLSILVIILITILCFYKCSCCTEQSGVI